MWNAKTQKSLYKSQFLIKKNVTLTKNLCFDKRLNIRSFQTVYLFIFEIIHKNKKPPKKNKIEIEQTTPKIVVMDILFKILDFVYNITCLPNINFQFVPYSGFGVIGLSFMKKLKKKKNARFST